MILSTEWLPTCPAPGEGVHAWILSAAWACKRRGLSAESACGAIRSALSRPPRRHEIEDAVKKAFSKEPEETFPPAIKASYDAQALAKLAEKLPVFSENDLEARSPISPDESAAAAYLRQLFKPGEKVALFTRMTGQPDLLWVCPPVGEFLDVQELNFLANPTTDYGVWFLANPVSGEPSMVGRLANERNPQGLTLRAEENLTAFRYMVVESDQAPPALWVKALAQLPLPIASVVTSGGRSIHALIRVDAGTAIEWKAARSRIASALITLGADQGAMTTVRLTRLPFCLRREKAQWQRVLFLNPNPTSQPIRDMPLRPSNPLSRA